jgi:hypothetical protein
VVDPRHDREPSLRVTRDPEIAASEINYVDELMKVSAV